MTLADRTNSAARDARKLIKPIRNDIIALTQALVRTDSCAVPPDGKETPAQRVLQRFLKDHGLKAELYDTGFLNRSRHRLVRKDRNYKGRCNLITRLGGTGRGKSLLMTGHIDTVPPGPNPWRMDPLSGEIRGGRLYGRGSFDMKGGLAAHFAAAIALKRAGVKLAGDLLCESVVDEEWAGGGGTLAGRLRGDNADACVITEGTGLSVVRATRGGHFFDIIATAGDASAYFSTDEVLSPAGPMGRLLGWAESWKLKRKNVRRGKAYASFDDPAPVQILALEANRFDADSPWSVPLEAKLRLYFQFLPHEDVQECIKRIRKSFETFCRRDPFFKVFPPRWRDVVWPPLSGHELPAGHPWTRCLAESSQAILKNPPSVTAAPYPCDAFICQREFAIPTLLFGPCGAGAHNANEYVTTRSLLQTAETLLTAVIRWCS